MTQPWPLFGLRLRSARLELRPPTDDDLLALAKVARAGIHPPEEMPFGIPWTDAPSPRFEREFVQFHWRLRAEWRPDNWRLELGVWLGGHPVGIQGLGAERLFVLRTVGTGSWLGREFQGGGIGKEMRAAVLAFAFDDLAAEWATSTAFEDNLASAGVSRALGYVEDGRFREAPRGVAREMIRYRLTVEQWRSGPRPPVDVTGFDEARSMFQEAPERQAGTQQATEEELGAGRQAQPGPDGQPVGPDNIREGTVRGTMGGPNQQEGQGQG